MYIAATTDTWYINDSDGNWIPVIAWKIESSIDAIGPNGILPRSDTCRIVTYSNSGNDYEVPYNTRRRIIV